MKILKDEKSIILPRREVLVEINHAGCATPSHKKLKEDFVNKFKKDKSLVIIKKINSSFGESNSKVEVLLYEDETSMKNIERIKEKKEESGAMDSKQIGDNSEESKSKEKKIEEKPVEGKVEKKQDDKETKTKEQETK